MKQGTFTVNILEPENGGYLTNKEAKDINDTILSKKIFLAVNDSAENYKEITEEEAETIKEAKRKIDPSLYPTEERERADKISFFNSINTSLASERKSINTMALTDTESIKYKVFYPLWKDLIGKEVDEGFKFVHKDILYKVRQKHTIANQWIPRVGTESLYEEINETNSGTLEDPIPYNNNMELELGKYYSQNGVIYHCTRGTGQPVFNPLSELVGLFVEVVEG